MPYLRPQFAALQPAFQMADQRDVVQRKRAQNHRLLEFIQFLIGDVRIFSQTLPVRLHRTVAVDVVFQDPLAIRITHPGDVEQGREALAFRLRVAQCPAKRMTAQAGQRAKNLSVV